MDGRKRVLLADSSEEFRWLMWRSAANHNFFSLATVGSGRDVLLCMQKQTADLLLMDTALPDVCGLTVLDELQRRGTAPQRVIQISANGSYRKMNKDGKAWTARLSHVVYRMTPTTLERPYLNPDWVEWLMGFPRKWTDIPFGPKNPPTSRV